MTSGVVVRVMLFHAAMGFGQFDLADQQGRVAGREAGDGIDHAAVAEPANEILEPFEGYSDVAGHDCLSRYAISGRAYRVRRILPAYRIIPSATASATLMPSIAAERMPPA